MPHIKSSRRVPPLQDVDYDHEINLVDHDCHSQSVAALERVCSETNFSTTVTEDNGSASSRVDSRGRLKQTPSSTLKPNISSAFLSIGGAGAALGGGPILPVPSEGSSSAHYTMAVPNDAAASVVAAPKTEIRGVSRILIDESKGRNSLSTVVSKQPEIIISAVPPSRDGSAQTPCTHRSTDHEWVIDVLYENQRGLFLCGMPLFSAEALGNLDPAPWTNAFHKPSLTDPHEAQLPDPSWQWAWSEWRINHDSLTDCDEDGWEYSFMFSNKFSWHGRTWYSSFVRRRAWTRKRIRKHTGAPGLIVESPTSGYGHTDLLEPRQSSEQDRSGYSPGESSTSSPVDQCPSRTGRNPSREPNYIDSRSSSTRGRSRSMASASRMSRIECGLGEGLDNIEIYDARHLLNILRVQRVDREKLEAIRNYLKNAQDDFQHLQDAMHEIMGIFVFQNSRRQALAQVAQACEDVEKNLQEIGSDANRCDERTWVTKRLEYLEAAKKHAEEEVRKLAYWSDVRALENRLGEIESASMAVAREIRDNSESGTDFRNGSDSGYGNVSLYR
ncbi:hypothetical protein Cpir12675_001898 [Ceratocystis pirilliformis]|uniref:Meiotically up-regulated 65 protein n=1 Tax=Ceratocystis pirilliformis TaxID=259994 RepID=A0ABR3ZCL7_9PEZI